MLNADQVKEIAAQQKAGIPVVDERFDELYEYYCTISPVPMPYGVAKARTGDPYQWIENQLNELNS